MIDVWVGFIDEVCVDGDGDADEYQCCMRFRDIMDMIIRTPGTRAHAHRL